MNEYTRLLDYWFALYTISFLTIVIVFNCVRGNWGFLGLIPAYVGLLIILNNSMPRFPDINKYRRNIYIYVRLSKV